MEMECVWLVETRINLETGACDERGILYAPREACESTQATLSAREEHKVWQTFARAYKLKREHEGGWARIPM